MPDLDSTLAAADELPLCCYKNCVGRARWAIVDVIEEEPIVQWHACAFHVHPVLSDVAWTSDHVRIYDLDDPVSRS